MDASGGPLVVNVGHGREEIAEAVSHQILGCDYAHPTMFSMETVEELARSLTLFAAASAGVAAIDTVYTDFRDLDGLAKYVSNARRDGFSGMLAIHPDQVAAINEAFTPSTAEIARAQRIVDLFVDNVKTLERKCFICNEECRSCRKK